MSTGLYTQENLHVPFFIWFFLEIHYLSLKSNSVSYMLYRPSFLRVVHYLSEIKAGRKSRANLLMIKQRLILNIIARIKISKHIWVSEILCRVIVWSMSNLMQCHIRWRLTRNISFRINHYRYFQCIFYAREKFEFTLWASIWISMVFLNCPVTNVII